MLISLKPRKHKLLRKSFLYKWEHFLKAFNFFREKVVYLGPYLTPMKELFCKISFLLKAAKTISAKKLHPRNITGS